MYRPYSELVSEFSNWQDENNMIDDPNEYMKYIWEIPQSVINQWKTELDDDADLFTDEEIEQYKTNFDEGGSILGIYNVVKDQSETTTVKLYKLTEIDKEFAISDILVTKNYRLESSKNPVELPDGNTLELPVLIKYESIKFNEPFDLVDHDISLQHGVLNGEKYQMELRDENKVNENSLLATINYKTGDLHLIRNFDSNEDKFVEYYNMLLAGMSSGGAGGGGGTTVGTVIEPYDYLTVSGTYIVLGEPVELVFTFDCSYENGDEPNNNKAIMSALKGQDTTIKSFISNYDFEIGGKEEIPIGGSLKV